KPPIGRNNDAARLPINPLHLLAFRPQYRVALAGQDNNVRAGTVPVAFLIGPHREFGDMRAHGVFRQVELHVAPALAALDVVVEPERWGIGLRVGVNEYRPGEAALTAEVALSSRFEAVKKSVVAVKNIIEVVKKVVHEAVVSDGEIAFRSAAAGIAML